MACWSQGPTALSMCIQGFFARVPRLEKSQLPRQHGNVLNSTSFQPRHFGGIRRIHLIFREQIVQSWPALKLYFWLQQGQKVCFPFMPEWAISRWEIRHMLPPHSLFPKDMLLLLKPNGRSCHLVSPFHFFLLLISSLQRSTSRDNSHFPEIYDLLHLFFLCTCHCCLNHGRSCGNSHSSLLFIFLLFDFIIAIDF